MSVFTATAHAGTVGVATGGVKAAILKRTVRMGTGSSQNREEPSGGRGEPSRSVRAVIDKIVESR